MGLATGWFTGSFLQHHHTAAAIGMRRRSSKRSSRLSLLFFFAAGGAGTGGYGVGVAGTHTMRSFGDSSTIARIDVEIISSAPCPPVLAIASAMFTVL